VSKRQARVRAEAKQAKAEAERQEQKKAEVYRKRHEKIERKLSKKELREVEELSLQGLVRSAEAQEHRQATLDLLATTGTRKPHSRYAPERRFDRDQAEAIVDRWASKGRL
jgi:hypothetical protein